MSKAFFSRLSIFLLITVFLSNMAKAQDYSYPSPYKPVQELRHTDTGMVLVTKIFNGIIGQPVYMPILDFSDMYGNNIYTNNGTLTETRTVDLSDKTLELIGDNWRLDIGESTPVGSGFFVGSTDFRQYQKFSIAGDWRMWTMEMNALDLSGFYRQDIYARPLGIFSKSWNFNYVNGCNFVADQTGVKYRTRNTDLDNWTNFKLHGDKFVYEVERLGTTNSGMMYEDFTDITPTANTLMPKSYIDGIASGGLNIGNSDLVIPAATNRLLSTPKTTTNWSDLGLLYNIDLTNWTSGFAVHGAGATINNEETHPASIVELVMERARGDRVNGTLPLVAGDKGFQITGDFRVATGGLSWKPLYVKAGGMFVDVVNVTTNNISTKMTLSITDNAYSNSNFLVATPDNVLQFPQYNSSRTETNTATFGTGFDNSGNLVQTILPELDLNFAEDNLIFSGDRTHNLAGNDLNIENGANHYFKLRDLGAVQFAETKATSIMQTANFTDLNSYSGVTPNILRFYDADGSNYIGLTSTNNLTSDLIYTLKEGTGVQYIQSFKSSGVNPVGVTTPDYLGQIYIDETEKSSYVAVGVTSSDWTKQTNVVRSCAEIYIEDTAPQVLALVSGVPSKITGYSFDLAQMVGFSYATGTITKTSAGTQQYKVSGTMSGSFATSNTVLKVYLRVNGVVVGKIAYTRKIGVSNDIGDAGFSGLYSFALNDDIEVWATVDNTNNLTTEQFNCSIVQVD